MADNESPRFRIPFPKENAESWYATFEDMLANIDSRVFDNLEHLNLIHVELPDVEIQDIGGGEYHFVPHARAVFLSRTHHVDIEVNSRYVVLQPRAILGAILQSGAVGPQSVEWELWPNRMEIDGGMVPLGYVHDDYTITWFNATHLDVGVVTRLFSDSGLITGDSKVKVTAADTTEDFLHPKVVAGPGIALAVLNAGANEQLQITATGMAAVAMKTGVGDPDGVEDGDFVGQLYTDTATDGFYVCAVAGSPGAWVLVGSVPKSGATSPDGVVSGVLGQVYLHTGVGLYMCMGGTSWSLI